MSGRPPRRLHSPEVSPRPAGPPPPTFAPSAPSISGGSEVIQIDPSGFPRRVWSDSQEFVYAISFDPAGRPILGTGNKGQLFRIDSDLLSTRLLSADPTQITALIASRQGALYAATGNIGRVYRVGPAPEKEGTFESEVLDAGIFSQWGRLISYGEPNGGSIKF